jgi:regulator of protease activity HflC (stomatin/prohibitin superfamily)
MAWKPSKDSIVQEEESWTPPSGSVVSEEEVTPEEDQVEEEEPSMTKKGVAGAVVRGVSPTAAQAGAGALLGIPFGPPGMAIGAAGGVAAGQLADLTIDLVNSNFGTNYSNTKDAVTHVLNKIGVPEAESSGEKIIQAVTEGAAQMGGGATALGALSKATTPAEAILPVKERIASEEVRKFTKLMGQRPVEQALTGAAAGGAMEAIEQGGGGALAQLGGGLGAGIAVPIAAAAGRGGLSLLPRTAAQKARQAEELASSAYQGMVVDKKQALDDLARSQEVSNAQVRMMTGDITGDPGLLAMQDMLERESNVLASRKMENIAGMSRKLGEGLAPTGASPEETQQYFKSVIDNIVSESEKNKQVALAQGDAESAKLIENARAKAAAIKADADKGVLNAEDAFQQVKDEYENLFSDLSSLKESTVKDKLSESAFEAIKRQKDREKIYINDLYDAAEKEVPKFYQKNTAEAKAGLVKEFGEERRLPSEVQKILGEVQDVKGNMKLRTLDQLRADIRAINSEIRAAQSSAARQAEVPALIKFKQSLNDDISSLEGVSENLKKANRAYYEYAQRYKEGASGDVFGPKALNSKTIDQFIGRSEASASPEEIQRLRDAIIGKKDIPNLTPDQVVAAEADRVTAIRNVSDWVLSKMSGEVKGTKTSKSIENWLQTKGNRIIEIFPESRKRISEIQDKFSTLEDQVANAKKSVLDFKKKRIAEGQNASLVDSQANALAKEIEKKYQEQVKKLDDEIKLATNPNSNPAARFVDGNPYEIVNKVMSNKVNAEQQVQNLLEQAAKDTTGKATEGLKNAFRGWMNSQARTTSKESVGKGIASHEANLVDFQVDLKKMNDLMQKGSATRNSLEMVFGKDSPELESIDKVRQQLDMMSRRSKLKVQGFQQPEDKAQDIKDTVLELAGIGLAGIKGYVAWKSTDLVKKVQRQYNREVIDLFKNMMIDSMSDPELARKLLLKVNEENFPTIQRVFADYGIKNLKASDFGLKTTEPEQEQEEPEISFEETEQQ